MFLAAAGAACLQSLWGLDDGADAPYPYTFLLVQISNKKGF
jgi:hypothetical protein